MRGFRGLLAGELYAVRDSDGRTYKVKPELTLDAAVGYAGGEHGVSELVLALLRPDARYQTIGRVRTGWSHAESQELATCLEARRCASSYRLASGQAPSAASFGIGADVHVGLHPSGAGPAGPTP